LIIDTALQLILVITPHWEAHQGEMYRFERASLEEPFLSLGKVMSIVVGQKGIAWGSGLHSPPENLSTERLKIEGDGKAPAGIFQLGPIFLDSRLYPAQSQTWEEFKMPVILMDGHYQAVDDPLSHFYNQIVNTEAVGMKDWSSSELMQRDDELYYRGLVIQHNSFPAIPGRGSCIFMHTWRNNASGTYGCTALSSSDLLEVVKWLDVAKAPLLIQLPYEEFLNKSEEWHLPELRASY
jgi:D-alanyl-D-alanine dipeptidase